MADISTYADLKTAVADYLDRSDLTARIPTFINMAEQRIMRVVRATEMEGETTITASITTGLHRTSFSASVLQIRSVRVSGQTYSELEHRNPVEFFRVFSDLPQGSNPKYYTIKGRDIYTAPGTTASRTVLINCFKRLAALTNDADTNTLLQRAGGLYLYGALLEAAPFLGNDARVLVWTAMWDQVKDEVQSAATYLAYSGDTGLRSSDPHIR